MAGVSNGDVSVMELDCERYVVPVFKGADFLIPVKGSSMYPKYSSGDIVACKKVPMEGLFFQWNKVYVLDTVQGPLIKRVAKGSTENTILAVSENPKYEPFELHLEQLRAVAIVMGVIRLE
jgi:phage repressor protein C with HTH and peptisase S24 domain